MADDRVTCPECRYGDHVAHGRMECMWRRCRCAPETRARLAIQGRESPLRAASRLAWWFVRNAGRFGQPVRTLARHARFSADRRPRPDRVADVAHANLVACLAKNEAELELGLWHEWRAL